MLRNDKGWWKSAALIKNSLEDLLEIDQMHKDLLEIDQVYKMLSDYTRDSRIFREIETRIGNIQIREGII